jgi:hypothetical protein
VQESLSVMLLDHSHGASERVLGYYGLANIGLLCIITIVKLVDFICRIKVKEWKKPQNRKRILFHILLIAATASDLPMYCTFILENEYNLTSYSFHKLETLFLFSALTITISDWSNVLFDLKEYQRLPFLLRSWTLLSINLVYSAIALVNFLFCYVAKDLEVYLDSPIYTTSLFFQIFISFALTFFMLSAGLKLSWRIRLVADDYTNWTTTTTGVNDDIHNTSIALKGSLVANTSSHSTGLGQSHQQVRT